MPCPDLSTIDPESCRSTPQQAVNHSLCQLQPLEDGLAVGAAALGYFYLLDLAIIPPFWETGNLDSYTGETLHSYLNFTAQGYVCYCSAFWQITHYLRC